MSQILFFILIFLLISSILSAYVGDSNREFTENENLSKNSYYVITAPKVWTSREESVCLVLLKEVSLPNAVIDVKITSINGREIFTQKQWPLNSYSQCLRIPIDEIRAERALLTVRLADVIDQSLEIRIKPSNGLTLIETSKPIYRPNERLEFRIITVNDWLRPIEEDFKSIAVENSKSMIVMKWTDISTKNGVIGLQLPIAEDNYQGIWKIKTVNTRNVANEKIFKVYDYDTPNTMISIDSPNYINAYDSQSNFKLCVRNGFGRPLRGIAKVFAGYVKFNWDRTQMLKHIASPYELREFQIHGCHDLQLDSSKLYWNSSKPSEQNLKLSVQFIDSNNGFIEEKYWEIPVVAQDLLIAFPSIKLMRQYFKPGLPYFGHVLTVRPDHSPAPDQQLTLCHQSRDTPWVSLTDYVCQQLTTNSDGLLEFTIPPMNKKAKQIAIKVYSTLRPSIESKLILEPTFSPSDEYMAVKPIVNTNHCNDFVEFDVFFNKDLSGDNRQLYYQTIGQGFFHEPQVHQIRQTQRWSEMNTISDTSNTLENYDIWTTKLRVKLPAHSPLNNNLVNRVLMYYLDSSDNLIADSNAYLTTCADQSSHSTRIAFERDIASNDEMKLVVSARRNTTCALRVAKNRPYNSLKKINQFIEQFNVRQELGARDKCEKSHLLRGSEAESSFAAPYDLDESAANPVEHYNPVINYGDAWDSFNEIGLVVSSNAKLDESPCDYDLYPKDILSQLSEIRSNQIKSIYSNRMKRIATNQIRDIEKSLFNEIFVWYFDTTARNPVIERQIQMDHARMGYQHLYADSMCINKDIGITYSRTRIDNLSDYPNSPFKVMIVAPKQSRIGDTLVYKAIIEKNINQSHNCLPIQIGFESAIFYERVGEPSVQCICGNTEQLIQMMIRPKTVGAVSVRIVAEYPQNLNMNSDVMRNCINRTNSVEYSPQIFNRQLSVSPMGILTEQSEQHLVCSQKQNKTPEVVDLSDTDEMGRDSSDMVVTNDIIEPMLAFIKSRMSSRNHNALDALSAFAASYYLQSYSSNMSIDVLNRDQLTGELSKAFQSLMTYRHSDGSYSLFKSGRHKSDLGLTVSVFRLLAQSKPYLAFVENGQRVNRLKETMIWIFEQQSDDGCFHIGHQRLKTKLWPISFEDNYQLTGYVLASLLETGLDFDTKALTKAYNCLANNSLAIQQSIADKPLSAILFTYIQLLKGNALESKQWMAAMKVLNNLDESDLLSREVLSYLALSYYLSKDFESARSVAKRLMKTSNALEAPISCYAISKLWPLLKYKTSAALKVYKTNNSIASRLVLNETHSAHRLNGPIVSIDGHQSDGCLVVTNNKVKIHLATQPTKFDIRMDALDKGFGSCSRRRLRVCVSARGHTSSEHPVVRMQIVTGFAIDKRLIKKVIDSEVVAKYKTRGSEVMLFLHPLHTTRREQCFTVPVVQRHEFDDKNKAFIKIYDYYNEDISDVIAYEIPLQCQIDS